MAITLAQLVVLQTMDTMVMGSNPDSDTELIKEFMNEWAEAGTDTGKKKQTNEYTRTKGMNAGTHGWTNSWWYESDARMEELTKGVKQQMNAQKDKHMDSQMGLNECTLAWKRPSEERG